VTATFWAGSGGIILREALALDDERYSNTILAPVYGALFDRAEEAGLSVIRLNHMGAGRRVYPWADVEAVRELAAHLRAGDFDLVHTHAGRAGLVGRLAARQVGVPAVVHTLHGFPFNEFQSPLTRSVLRSVERRLARITDYFLTDGTMVASEAVRLKIAPPDRIRALISPIDAVTPVTEATRRHARRLLGLPDGAKVVGTTARLAKQKAPLDMVAAIAALKRPDVYMVWLGDGELRAKTEKLVRKEGLGERFLLRCARRRFAPSPRVRRVRDAELVGGSFVFRRRGDDLRDSRCRNRSELRSGSRHPRTDGVAGETGRCRLAEPSPGLHAR
jgi:glycosyltransferase involved in cell wall biosynthesis